MLALPAKDLAKLTYSDYEGVEDRVTISQSHPCLIFAGKAHGRLLALPTNITQG